MKSFVAISAAFVVLVSSLVSANQFNYKSQADFNSEVLDIFRKTELYSLDLLTHLSNGNRDKDFACSPYSLWVLLLLVAEGVADFQGKSNARHLHLDVDHKDIRETFNEVIGALEIKTPSVEVAKWQGMFADFNQLVKEDYIKLVNTFYNTSVKRLDFNNIQNVMHAVNEELSIHTNHLLQNPIPAKHFVQNPRRSSNAQFLMTSTLYLKARWQFPLSERLYNKLDNGDDTVKLVSHNATFRSRDMRNLQAIVTEVPLGNEGRLSLLVMEPYKGVSVYDMIANMRMIGLRPIFEQLANASSLRNGTNIIVPKFKATMEFSTDPAVTKMRFYAIFRFGLYKILGEKNLNNIQQRYTITVNEEGIEVATVDSAVFNGSPVEREVLNYKPNLYLIIDPLTYFIHFAFAKGEPIY